ncbi:MAG: DUF5318 domain-containing protein [Firmicutes bacterium]|jgi:hypothetical protein|nr:DUF5318 domain-containing protein [Bacillota bacterium]
MEKASGRSFLDRVTDTNAAWIEYRLSREILVRDFEKGRISKADICDAQPELLRLAHHIGQSNGEKCPICKNNQVVLVYFMFGPQLPRSGKPVAPGFELLSMMKARPDANFYEVEICTGCNWNFLMRTFEGAALKHKKRQHSKS